MTSLGDTYSNPESLVTFQDKLYFSADNGLNGRELWSFDKNENVPILVANINESPTEAVNFHRDFDYGSNPEFLTPYKDKLYFSATHRALWP